MGNFAYGPDDVSVAALYQGLKAIFNDAYGKALDKGARSLVATTIPSGSASEDYPWLGAVPKMREFLGERQFKDLKNFTFNIVNKTWENTLGVKRTDLEDNKLGSLRIRITELAQEAARYQDELVFTFLKDALGSAAAPYLCYDGQGLFDTDHPTPDGGSANQDNKDASALALATLWAAIAKMKLYADDTGRILEIRPNLLIVEPILEQTARELLEGKGAATTTTGAIALGKAMGIELLVSPFLATTTTVANGYWFLADTNRPVRGVIFQERSPIEFNSLTEDSDAGFIRDEFAFGSRSRNNVGSGAWFTIYGNSGAA